MSYCILPSDGVLESINPDRQKWSKLLIVLSVLLLLAAVVSLLGFFPFYPVGVSLLIVAAYGAMGAGVMHWLFGNDEPPVELTYSEDKRDLDRLALHFDAFGDQPPVQWERTQQGGKLRHDQAECLRRQKLAVRIAVICVVPLLLIAIGLLIWQPQEYLVILLIACLASATTCFLSIATLTPLGWNVSTDPLLDWDKASQSLRIQDLPDLSKKHLVAMQICVAVVRVSTREGEEHRRRSNVVGWLEANAVLARKDKIRRVTLFQTVPRDLHSMRALQQMCSDMDLQLLNHATPEDFQVARNQGQHT